MIENSKTTSEGYLVPIEEKHLGIDDDALFRNYQLEPYNFAIDKCRNRKRAIDIGANVGIMSVRMARDFKTVESFEPLFYDYLKNNTSKFTNVNIHPYALGEIEKTAAFQRFYGNSGKSRINEEGEYSVEVKTLDSYNFKDVGFIKIDVEGYEWEVLQGGLETVKNCDVFMIEVHKRYRYRSEIERFFKHKNYRLKPFAIDYVFWREQ